MTKRRTSIITTPVPWLERGMRVSINGENWVVTSGGMRDWKMPGGVLLRSMRWYDHALDLLLAMAA